MRVISEHELVLYGITLGMFLILFIFHIATYVKGIKEHRANLFYSFLNLGIAMLLYGSRMHAYLFPNIKSITVLIMGYGMMIVGFSIIGFGKSVFTVEKENKVKLEYVKYIYFLNSMNALFLIAATIFYLSLKDSAVIYTYFAIQTSLAVIYLLFLLVFCAFNFKSFTVRQFTILAGFFCVVFAFGIGTFCYIYYGKIAPFIVYYGGLLIMVLIFGYVIVSEFANNAKVLQDTNKKLKDRTAELNSALNFKSNLLTTTAHHTKTPLTLIKNGFETLFTMHPELRHNKQLTMIKRNTDLMTRDIVNIFDMAQLEQGKSLNSEVINFSLSEMLKDKVKLFCDSARLKGIHIKEVIDSDIFVEADDLALNRVIDNLLDNAIKYCDRGTIIKVTLKGDESKVVLTVADDGPGIDREELPHIFERYYQIERDKQVSSGLGLGLALTKEIIDELGGAISVESQISRGTTFRIELTRTFAKKENESYRLTRPVESVSITVEECRRYKNCKTIMLVEDEPEMLLYLRDAFRDSYNIVVAVNGREALEKLESCKPDLIISDVMMAEVDGFGLKAGLPEQFRHIPFIFLTAKTKERDKIEGLNLGAVDYIYKPFSIEEIKLKVEKLIDNSEQLESSVAHRILKAASREIEQIEKKGPTFEELCVEYGLTDREVEVVEVLKEVSTNQDAADKLYVSLSTIKKHVNNILHKTGVKNQKQLFELLYR